MLRCFCSLTSPIRRGFVVYFVVYFDCGRAWPAAYINFNQNIHQIQVLTKPLCRAHAMFICCRTTTGVPNIMG